MRPNQPYLTRLQKLLLSGRVGVEDLDQGGRVGQEETVAVAVVADLRTGHRRPVTMDRGIKAPNTPIYHLGSGKDARCIISGANQLFSVLSQAHARGKTSSAQSPPRIEGLASPV